jgi:hypothetical protein
MKSNKLSAFFAATLLALPTLSLAQTTAVPAFISYQGRVVDASGNNVGTGTPVNRTVIFRIWDNQSSTNTANLIYSEAQTVTISEGEFSVLVGQGVPNTTQTFSYSETARKLADLATAFNGSTRYLGVTVAATGTIATTDNEITPRQQIVSAAYALRAKFAESIGSSNDLVLTPLSGTATNHGLGWYGSGRLFNGIAVDGPVLYGNAGGALGSNAGTQKAALLWNASGQVGIGATTGFATTNKLTLQGDDATTPAQQLSIRGNANNDKRLLVGFDTTANKASLQSYTGSSTTAPLLLNPSGGNVGINKTAPGVALDVTGAITASGAVTAASFAGNGANLTALDGADISAGTVPLAALVAAVQQALVPTGTIVAYGGTTAPAGWLLCNGASISRTGTYANLFSAISTRFGTASSSTFNVPDFRGRFLRGWDDATGRDPDRASRNAMNTGGATGNSIGSIQGSMFTSHVHMKYFRGYKNVEEGNDKQVQSRGIIGSDPRDDEGNTEPTGGSETRPINAYVNYIIKY